MPDEQKPKIAPVSDEPAQDGIPLSRPTEPVNAAQTFVPPRTQEIADESPKPSADKPAQPAPQKCAVCGHVNRVGILVCENCGTNLMTGREASIGTNNIGQQPPRATETHEMMIGSAGSTRFEANMMLRLEIDGAPTPIVIYPKTETSLGRRDPGTGAAPDIDLTAYAGYRKGVSRHHAMLRLREKLLEIYDLGSSNGTAVNGVRLSAHQPYPLRDGDEITLGKMVIRVLFQTRSRTRSLT
jgi:hypothetical protein